MRLRLLIILCCLGLGCDRTRPARETLPVVHLICPGMLDTYVTRQQFERLAFSPAVPCVFEWGESFPSPQASASPQSPEATP